MLRFGNVMIGSSKVDVMQMSFVLELVGNVSFSMSSMEDPVWFRESSASLLDKVESISDNIAIRELKGAERVQMDKFKKSHDASHQFKVVYKNGATQIESNVKTTNNLDLFVDSFLNLQTRQGPINAEQSLKSAELREIEGKSFVIESAARSNCDSLESLGLKGKCNGNIWIEKL